MDASKWLGLDASQWLGLFALVFAVVGSAMNVKVFSSWITPRDSDTGQPRFNLTADAAKKARNWNRAGWTCIVLGFACGVGATLVARS
jgi:hypothetical protein